MGGCLSTPKATIEEQRPNNAPPPGGEPPKVAGGAPAPEPGSNNQQQQEEEQWRMQQQKEQEALQQKQAYEAQQMQEQQQLQMQQQQQMHYQQQQMQMQQQQQQQQQMYMQQQQQQQQYGSDQQGYNPQYALQQQDPRYMQQQQQQLQYHQQQQQQQQQPPPMNPYQQPPHLAPQLPPGFQQSIPAPIPPRGLRQVNEEEEVNDGQGGWGGGAAVAAAGGGGGGAGGGVIGYQEQPAELQEYSYQDLVDATEDFQEHSVLGEGGFGKVYKGYVLDRFPVEGGPPVTATVAIKKLNPSGYQSKVEWMREILVLGKLNHPNLVRLIGYCAELEEMLLVYEFVPRGSLDYHLWPAPNVPADPLPWQARLRIAHDAACGLAHLHASNFIHRDFKAPNILIAENYAGKLTDFGLAKDGPDAGQTHVSTQIMGTMGYLDPRYAETGQLTVKSDVYAYGVVLLELLTGKKAMGISPGGKPKTLTSWARPYLNKARPDLESLVDPNLIDPFPEKVARTLAISAKHCIQDDTNMRPMMSDIVDTLRPLNTAINGRR
ncbi:hypothetical protein CLOM_g22599 [Closterium sp. NIES-68]|nr:hypothetical protein CLOM_g22599 [Closterium sp. NIES-68]